MSRLNSSRSFIPVRIAVLTVSDTRTLADDKSGDLLVARISEAGHILAAREIAIDEVEAIRTIVRGGLPIPGWM
jgi:molybdenum cofactor biosynthesis protein B